MDLSLLNTDILSEILKRKNPTVAQHAAAYLGAYVEFALSSFTAYEVRRGLIELNATVQLQRFETFRQNSQVLPVVDAILERAANLWALAGTFGKPRSDSDLIIAATALEHNRTLVTGNTSDFDWIPGLRMANWRMP